MGMTNSYMSAATIPASSEDLILNAWKWFNDLLEKDAGQSAGAFVLIEIMQPVRIALNAWHHIHKACFPPLTLDASSFYLLSHNTSLDHSLTLRNSLRSPPPRPPPQQPGRAHAIYTSCNSARVPSLVPTLQTPSPSKRSRRHRSRYLQRTATRIICRVSLRGSMMLRR